MLNVFAAKEPAHAKLLTRRSIVLFLVGILGKGACTWQPGSGQSDRAVR